MGKVTQQIRKEARRAFKLDTGDEFMIEAHQYVKPLAHALASIALNEGEASQNRIAAAKAILERCLGKPRQQVQIDATHRTDFVDKPILDMTNEELDACRDDLLSEMEDVPEGYEREQWMELYDRMERDKHIEGKVDEASWSLPDERLIAREEPPTRPEFNSLIHDNGDGTEQWFVGTIEDGSWDGGRHPIPAPKLGA